LSIGLVLGQLVDALSAIAFLALIAIGLYIIFGMMRVINMAHGELYMLGAYTTWWVTDHGRSFWIGLLAAPLLVGLVGLLLERSVIRFLYARRDLSTLLATSGVSIILQRTVALTLGARPRYVAAPIKGNFVILGQNYLNYQVFAMVVAVAVIFAALLLFYKTSFGLRARATIENPIMAETFAVNTSRMNMASFALGAALAGFGGALIAPLVSVVPTMGLDFVVRSFLVVIVGGTQALVGAVGGAAVVGGTESLFTANLNGTLAQMIVLVLVMGVVLLRPAGLFGHGRI
jgi:branched-chain amino acid transport system permease protein/urea transport system permease protein